MVKIGKTINTIVQQRFVGKTTIAHLWLDYELV